MLIKEKNKIKLDQESKDVLFENMHITLVSAKTLSVLQKLFHFKSLQNRNLTMTCLK